MNTRLRSLPFASTLLSVLIVLVAGVRPAPAQELPAMIAVPGLPAPLVLQNSPLIAKLEADGTFIMRAAGKTNLFNHPGGKSIVHNAPIALFEPSGDFVLTARVAGALHEVYDVAALVVYENDLSWAKLCYENSAQKEATVVSVVTREYSDDCNSYPIPDAFVYLAIVRKGQEYSFHSSRDGKTWRLVRHFCFPTQSPIKIGFAVHCYTSGGFEAGFSEVGYRTQIPASLRQLR